MQGVKISIIIYQGGAGKLVYRQVYGLGSRDFQVFSVSAIFLTLWKKVKEREKKIIIRNSSNALTLHIGYKGLKILRRFFYLPCVLWEIFWVIIISF